MTDHATRRALAEELARARKASDDVFERLDPRALFDRPIAERHRLIFYLGHLEAFDGNLVRGLAAGMPGTATPTPAVDEPTGLDQLFARGIDPLDGDVPSDRPGDWPSPDQVRAYGRERRAAVDAAFADDQTWSHPYLEGAAALHALIEHRLMHVETLAYLMHRLPVERLRATAPTAISHAAAPPRRRVAVPSGTATLGRDHGFGWCNERGTSCVEVTGFGIDAHPVTNGDFVAFVRSGGYQDRSLWSDDDWAWRQETGHEHPGLWRRDGDRWLARRFAAEVPLPLDHPVYVSHAEASAYARWIGARLPTEAEWQRAAYGSPTGERAYPWGDAPPTPERGNFDLRRDDSTAVTAHPAGASAWGVHDLAGNGWEWTSTAFAPLPGFTPYPFYPGYSADFFDGRHRVLKGGSARTAARLLRRSFRNWFQPHYPHVYATFRLVED